jgi:L-fucose mutarotase
MLKNIDPVLSPDLLWMLAAMGHGDDIALVDANHPAEKIARATTSGRLVRLPGLAMARVARAILSLLPIDDFEPQPARRMLVVGDAAAIPEVQTQVQAELDRALGRSEPLAGIERFAAAGLRRRPGRRPSPLWLLPVPQGRDRRRARLSIASGFADRKPDRFDLPQRPARCFTLDGLKTIVLTGLVRWGAGRHRRAGFASGSSGAKMRSAKRSSPA